MSVEYRCDRCGRAMEPEQAAGYRLEVAGYQVALKPMGHLCPPCLIGLLQVAAQATTRAEVLAGGV